MSDDVQAIHEFYAAWRRASADGDLPKLLSLMAEDVVFLLPGRPPMQGRDGFASGFPQLVERFKIEMQTEIDELQVAGDWAFCRTRLTVTMLPRGAGETRRRSGCTLSILRKLPGGRWVLARDANLLEDEPAGV